MRLFLKRLQLLKLVLENYWLRIKLTYYERRNNKRLQKLLSQGTDPYEGEQDEFDDASDS